VPGLEWTSLLLTVCACALQYADADLRQTLVTDLGETAEALSTRYHGAGMDLSSLVRAGQGGLAHLQQLLHSSYWYKSSGALIECWHMLNTSSREARELCKIHSLGRALTTTTSQC
jgi:hypothetical protein